MNNIRSAKMNDLNAVLRIVRNAVQHMDDQGISQWDHLYPDRAILQADIEKSQMHVIVDEDSVMGFITLNEEESPEYNEISWAYHGRVLVVHRLTVHPEHQGRKLASQLMSFAEQIAAQKGYKAIRLDAFIHNPAAISLYEKRDYRNAGTVHFRKGPFYCYEKLIDVS